MAANFGNGNHACFLDLGERDVTDTFELANSGKSLAELKALRQAR
jgi:hypothetical protein